MSIQTELTRISDGVSDALVALEEKGVTIPDGIKVDGLADLIAAIEAGGALVYETDITLANDITGQRNKEENFVLIEHNLGAIPHTALLIRTQNMGAVSNEILFAFATTRGRINGFNLAGGIFSSATSAVSDESSITPGCYAKCTTISLDNGFSTSSPICKVTENTCKLCGQYNFATVRLRAGSTYRLVVMA